jgi:hypothetical protein
VQHRITAGYGNTPYDDKGYYHDRLELFCNINESSSEASTPTCGGDAFGTELTKSCWFGSSGLNLTFEWLLLGVSIRMLTEGTHSDPRQSGFWIPSLLQWECLPCFAGGRRRRGSPSRGCSGSTTQRLAEPRRRRSDAGGAHWSSTEGCRICLTRCSASLDRKKWCLNAIV